MAIPLGVFPKGTTSGFHIKNTHISSCFIEKGHAVSAVLIDNAKLFSQLMSKSRSLAEISERRLQPLLVNLRNYRPKVRFCPLITGPKVGPWHSAPHECAYVCVCISSMQCSLSFFSTIDASE